MNIPIIDIRISDRWKFAKVAFLVDREDFLIDIQKARKELCISELIPYNNVKEWEEKELDREVEKYPIRREKNLKKGIRKFVVPSTPLDNKIDELLKKYQKPTYFYFVIEYSILCGIVTDNEISKTAYCSIDNYESENPNIHIVITPDTKLKEIETMFQEEIPGIIKEYNDLIKTKTKNFDTISNIERNRKWYFLRKSGLSWSQLHKKVTSDGLVITKDGVRDAVNEYKTHLMEL